MRKSIAVALPILIFIVYGNLSAQKIIRPAIHSKTHTTLTLDSLFLDEDKTICYLSITNQNTEGTAWFCADKDISLRETSSNIRYQIIHSENIPVCPEAYKFNDFGEILSFRLIFPAIQNDIMEIDIVENCRDNCFSLQGIVLDPQLNHEIRQFEKGVSLFNERKYQEALVEFLPLESSVYVHENHYGYTLYIIPVIYEKLKEYSKAKAAYFSLKKSTILQKDYFLAKLRENTFFLELE